MYLVTGLPEGVARDTENAIRSALTLAGEKSLHGKRSLSKEYFDVSCLALIMDVAEGWLTGPAVAVLPAQDATLEVLMNDADLEVPVPVARKRPRRPRVRVTSRVRRPGRSAVGPARWAQAALF